MSNMRRHMVTQHDMTKEEVDRMTNKRLTVLDHLAHGSAGKVPGIQSSPAQLAGPADAAFAPSADPPYGNES